MIIGSTTFFVVLPYPAIIDHTFYFWLCVICGLVVAFICAASETAFGLACGEDEESPIYERNIEKGREYRKIANNTALPNEEREKASKLASEIEDLTRISENYKGYYNPTLIVANNVANIFVAVVSAAAAFNNPLINNAGVSCINGSTNDLILLRIQIRCKMVFGHLIPFPVNNDAFQAALALTLILIVGELLPKQIATSFAAPMAKFLLPAFRFFVYPFSLGTGRTFGEIGLLIEKIAASFAARPTSKPRSTNGLTIVSDLSKVTTANVSCDGGDAILGHPKLFLVIKSVDHEISCPYCGHTFRLVHPVPDIDSVEMLGWYA